MDILLLLIPLSVALALAIAAGFWWSVSNGQFDDLDGPAHRILADDDVPGAPADATIAPSQGDGAPAAGPEPAAALTSINPPQRS